MSYKRVVITEFSGPGVLDVVEETCLPEPEANEVRVKVLVAGVAFTDVMIRKGMYPDVKEKPPLRPDTIWSALSIDAAPTRPALSLAGASPTSRL